MLFCVFSGHSKKYILYKKTIRIFNKKDGLLERSVTNLCYETNILSR